MGEMVPLTGERVEQFSEERQVIYNLVDLFSWNDILELEIKKLRRRLWKEFELNIKTDSVNKYNDLDFKYLYDEVGFYDVNKWLTKNRDIKRGRGSQTKRLPLLYIFMRIYAEIKANVLNEEFETLDDYTGSQTKCLIVLHMILWNRYVRYRFEVDAVTEKDVYSLSWSLLRYLKDYGAEDTYSVRGEMKYLFGL